MSIAAALHELQERIGAGKVSAEAADRQALASDATGLAFPPDLVVRATREDDIRASIAVAARHRLPLVPRGGGKGYSGGALAVHGGILLSLADMNRVLEIDEANFLAVAEPGVVTADFQAAVEKAGLFYPPDPASLQESTLGGNVAENAGGPRCFKYGVTGNYVLGLDALLMSGDAIRCGTRTLKNVAGYDVKSLLVGSEGTLAVFSRIVLRLLPQPAARLLFAVDFASLEAGAAFVVQVVRSGITPSVLEFMDSSSLRAVHAHLGSRAEPGVNAALLVELDGPAAETAARAGRLRELAFRAGARGVRQADSAPAREELWLLRRSISPAIARLKPKKVNEDVVVPMGRIPEAVAFINRLGAERNLQVVLFGHFGDGNIHTNFMVDPADAPEMARLDAALEELFGYVTSCGGSISGEHGIGVSKKSFMRHQFGPVDMALFRAIKRAFDPGNLLNPGKIF